MASVDTQKTPRINFQTKVTNVPWTFFYGLLLWSTISIQYQPDK